MTRRLKVRLFTWLIVVAVFVFIRWWYRSLRLR